MGEGRSCVVWTALFLLCVTLSSGALAAEISAACIPADVQTKLESCPPGPGKRSVSGKRGPALRTTAPKRALKPTAPPEPEGPPPGERGHVLRPRVVALLIREIDGLERLLASTAAKSPDRPQLVRRLAESYVELEASAQSTAEREEAKAERRAKEKQLQEALSARQKAARARKTLEAARKGAIKHYRAFASAYPNHPKIDEVLYYLAYEHEAAGDHGSARKVYYELIRKAPKSAYVPRAYLAFGELFFQEAQGDPNKWELAAQAYREVLKYPAPANKVHGYARYKLAYVHWNRGELPEALDQLKKTLQFSAQHPRLPGATALGKSARRDMIGVYAASGAPERAFGFFAPLSGDAPGQSQLTLELCDSLGFAYLDIGRYREAITLYRDLARRDSGPRECHYQAQITSATQAVDSGNKPVVHRELGQLLALRNGFVKGDAPVALKRQCSNRTAEQLVETAMIWHLEAVGSGGVRGTNDERTKSLAADLYQRTLQSFSAQEFTKLEFPRIVRADWPTSGKIAYALADLEYSRGRFAECASAFDAVVASDPKAPEAAEAAYAAVVCYQKLYEAQHPKGSDRQRNSELERSDWQRLAPRPLAEGQKRMLAAIDRYLCWIEPPRQDRALYDQRVEVEFARARIYYEARHWEQAALGFRKIALTHPKHDAGIYAAHLFLESLNVLASRAEPPRRACIGDMSRDVPKLAKLYCAGPQSDELRGQCELLTRVAVGIERLRLEDLTKEAGALAARGDALRARERYVQAGDGYLALWRTHCETPLGRGEKPKACERADELPYNVAKAYQAARLLAKAMQARQTLLDPRYGFADGELALRATYELGQNYQAIAVYDRAADYFEQYVEATCKKKRRCGQDAERALADAVVLRLGLLEPERAIEAASQYSRWFGSKHPAETAQIAFAVAAHYAEVGKLDQTRRRLSAAMRLIDTKASLDVRVQAHALLARAEAKLGAEQRAAKEYERVIALWSDPKQGEAQIRALGSDSERRLGRALDAVGEALFFFAEQKRQRAEAVRFPVYRGAGTKAAVLAHINGPVAEWIKKKRPLIAAASTEYRKILDLTPNAPPRWVIAAGERVGRLSGKFVEEFRAAPIPDSIKSDPELRNAYYEALDRASEPQKLAARGAYETCLGYSVKYLYWDEHSRACEEWLARTYKADYHVIDEFRGAPTHRNDPLRERLAPVSLPLGTSRRRLSR